MSRGLLVMWKYNNIKLLPRFAHTFLHTPMQWLSSSSQHLMSQVVLICAQSISNVKCTLGNFPPEWSAYLAYESMMDVTLRMGHYDVIRAGLCSLVSGYLTSHSLAGLCRAPGTNWLLPGKQLRLLSPQSPTWPLGGAPAVVTSHRAMLPQGNLIRGD